MDVSPDKLFDLYEYNRTEESWVKYKRGKLYEEVDIKTFGKRTAPLNDLEWLELFKQRARRLFGGASVVAIVIASVVATAIVLARRAGRKTKGYSKEQKECFESRRRVTSCACCTCGQKSMEVTQGATELVSDNLWLVIVPVVDYFLYRIK